MHSDIPTHGGEAGIPEAKRAVWPTVLGWIALVWALLTGVATCCCFPWLLMVPKMGEMGGFDFPPVPSIMRNWIFFSMALGIILLIALVMGAIKLLRRRKSARMLLLFYSAVIVLMLPVDFVVGNMTLEPMAEWGRQVAAAQVDKMHKDGMEVPEALEEQARTTEVTTGSRVQVYVMPLIFASFPIVLGALMLAKKKEMADWEA